MTYVKKALISTALLAAFFTGFALNRGCNCTHPYSLKDIENPKYESTIRISDDAFPVHYKFSQAEGERQLIELSKKTKKMEDVWIYRVRNGESVWIDVGREHATDYNNKGEVSGYSASYRFDDLANLIKPGDEVALYHIHPDIEGEINLIELAVFVDLPSTTDWTNYGIMKDFVEKKGAKLIGEKSITKYFTLDYSITGQKNDKQIGEEIIKAGETHALNSVAKVAIDKIIAFEKRIPKLDGSEADKAEIRGYVSEIKSQLEIIKKRSAETLRGELDNYTKYLDTLGYKLDIQITKDHDRFE